MTNDPRQSLPPGMLRLMEEESIVEADVLRLAVAERDILPHLQLVAAALDLLRDLFLTVNTSDEVQHRRVHMILRVHNSMAAALSLARNGYFLHSFMAQRDLMETALLVDYFIDQPDEFAAWYTCPDAKRRSRFHPGRIRKALNERDSGGTGTETWRDRQYRVLSQHAVHAHPEHWKLARKGNDLFIGPFCDPEILRNCLLDLAKLSLLGTNLTAMFIGERDRSLAAKAEFLDHARAWAATYMPGFHPHNQ